MAEPGFGSDPLRDRIIDEALAVAEADAGWHDLRLHLVAERLGVPLSAVLDRFRDADAIADAWFARSVGVMLREPEPGFGTLPPSERVHSVLMRWFDAQAAHRRAVRRMIGAKLHPSHPHHWVPMVFSLSRLIHWVQEAARLEDASPGQRRTGAFLYRNLQWLGRLPQPFAAS
jgi:AcrR family transcriptional regulator